MNNQPAFPATAYDENGHMAQGMTLRDYFAAKAMQSLVVNRSLADLYSTGATAVVHQAYVVADAMLKARES